MITVAQQNAFTSGAGGTLTMGNFSLVFALVASTVILLFSGWVLLSAYRQWSDEKIDLHKFVWAIMRVLIVVIIFGYYVRP